MHFLVIEDNQAQAESLCAVLALHGHGCQTAATGLDAVRHVAAGPPDVVILDLRLPHFDAVEFLHYLRERPATRETPVIVSTGLPAEDIPDAVKADPCVRVLIKPWHVPRLLKMLGAEDLPPQDQWEGEAQ